jgi:hypothetical protein
MLATRMFDDEAAAGTWDDFGHAATVVYHGGGRIASTGRTRLRIDPSAVTAIEFSCSRGGPDRGDGPHQPPRYAVLLQTIAPEALRGAQFRLENGSRLPRTKGEGTCRLDVVASRDLHHRWVDLAHDRRTASLREMSHKEAWFQCDTEAHRLQLQEALQRVADGLGK